MPPFGHARLRRGDHGGRPRACYRRRLPPQRNDGVPAPPALALIVAVGAFSDSPIAEASRSSRRLNRVAVDNIHPRRWRVGGRPEVGTVGLLRSFPWRGHAAKYPVRARHQLRASGWRQFGGCWQENAAIVACSSAVRRRGVGQRPHPFCRTHSHAASETHHLAVIINSTPVTAITLASWAQAALF